jgi:Zn-finger nucleic acid-binding protein
MNCPDCRGQLTPVLYEGVSIHVCPACKGSLLDEQKLSQIEINREKPIPRDQVHTKPQRLNNSRICPGCNIGLEKSKYGKYFPRSIDKCVQCNLIWLDEGELEDIQIAYEMYDENTNKKPGPKPEKTEFKCPKCGFAQDKGSSCVKCGIYYEKYAAMQAEISQPLVFDHTIPDKPVRIPGNLGTFGVIGFVRDEIKQIPGIDMKPGGGIRTFSSRVGYALSLGFREKEIFVFGLLQWVAIGLAYLLWIQMLDWIPEDVWKSASESKGGSIADWVLFAWAFVCVGVAAFPVGVLTGCMGAAHFLHKQGRESSVAMCLKLVLPHSWSLWIFHWIDGWITVLQIMERLPKKNDNKSLAQKAVSEALYYAWKLGISGILPSILTGNSLVKSAKNSIVFVREDFVEVAQLRAGYSVLCWVVGIGAYVGAIFLMATTDIVPQGDQVYSHIYTIYFWMTVPIMIALAFVMLILRPIYVLALCDLYSEHLGRADKKVSFPANPAASVSALVAFGILCLILAMVFFYRVELGIMEMLATPYR